MFLFLVGLLAILSQVVLLRELNVAFYGVELVYAIALAAWMAGTAGGAALGSRRGTVSSNRLAALLIATAFLLPFDVAWIRVSRIVAGGTPGVYLPFPHQLLVLGAAVLPPAWLLGIAFRWAANEAAERHPSLARSYAVEAAGSAAGALLATGAFVVGIQTFTLALVAAFGVPAAVAGWKGLLHPPEELPSRVWRACSNALLVAAAISAGIAAPIDLAMTAWSHPSLTDSRDSPYARITTTRNGSQQAVFLDDVLVYESETTENEPLAHLAALHHPQPERVLLLGGSAEQVDVELLKHRPTTLDVVELDAALVSSSVDPTGARRVTICDPRAFLSRPGRYDLIVVSMPPPASGLTNRFYTTEFFRACAARLAPGGVIGLRLHLAENVITPALAQRTASIVQAIRATFRHVLVFAGEQAVAVASNGELPSDAGTLIERLTARRLSVRLISPAYLRYRFADDRRALLSDQLDRLRVEANSDDLPACYRFATLLWLAKFFPSLISVSPGSPVEGIRRRPGPWLFGALVGGVLTMAALRRRPVLKASFVAAVAGASGMILEMVLVLAYQARTGALFEHIGLLLTVFMLGLSAGGWLAGGWVSRRGADRSFARWRTPLVLMLFGLLLLSTLTAAVADGRLPLGLVRALELLAAIGFVVGALFACAIDIAPHPDLGHLYAADLLGGCLGSLAAGLLLVPFAGLSATAALAGVLALFVVAAA